MYLIDFSLFLKQLLPPPWRLDWRYRLVHTLLSPLKVHMECFISERLVDFLRAQANMQVFALQSALSAMAGTYVAIEHRDTAFMFYVRVPATLSDRDEKVRQIEGYLRQHNLAGISYEIVN